MARVLWITPFRWRLNHCLWRQHQHIQYIKRNQSPSIHRNWIQRKCKAIWMRRSIGIRSAKAFTLSRTTWVVDTMVAVSASTHDFSNGTAQAYRIKMLKAPEPAHCIRAPSKSVAESCRWAKVTVPVVSRLHRCKWQPPRNRTIHGAVMVQPYWSNLHNLTTQALYGQWNELIFWENITLMKPPQLLPSVDRRNTMTRTCECRTMWVAIARPIASTQSHVCRHRRKSNHAAPAPIPNNLSIDCCRRRQKMFFNTNFQHPPSQITIYQQIPLRRRQPTVTIRVSEIE